MGGIRIRLDQVPELQRNGGAIYLKGKGLKHPVLIIHDGTGDSFLAFVNRCTHIGHRKLDPVPGKQIIRCCSICHSTYDFDGKRLSGPAKHPLKRYKIDLVDGELLIYADA